MWHIDRIDIEWSLYMALLSALQKLKFSRMLLISYQHAKGEGVFYSLKWKYTSLRLLGESSRNIQGMAQGPL